MPTPKKAARIGSSSAHQRLMLANLATELITYREIRTTGAKAKLLQPYIEKLITKAKRGSIHDRRLVSKKIRSKEALYELFDVIIQEIDFERKGGYTRITKLENRRGDNAPMASIEIISDKLVSKVSTDD